MCRGILGVVVQLGSQLARLGLGVSGTFAGGERTAWHGRPSPVPSEFAEHAEGSGCALPLAAP